MVYIFYFGFTLVGMFFCCCFFLFAGKYFTHCVAELLQFHYRYIDLPGAAKPRCKANGEYESMQCSGSVCYCVNAIGVIIPGSSVPLWAKPRCKGKDQFSMLAEAVYITKLVPTLVEAVLYATHYFNQNDHCRHNSTCTNFMMANLPIPCYTDGFFGQYHWFAW